MKILLTGGSGFIGHSLLPKLKSKGHEVVAPTREEYNLLKQNDVLKLFNDHKVDAVIHLAGHVGGILANKTYPADFIYDNLGMNTFFLNEARKAGIKRLIYSMCGCSFGKDSPNPIKEEYLLKGLPDENAMFYSLGKAINHFQLVAYRRQYGVDWATLIPGNAYGPYDNFSDKNSHVIPGLIRRFHFAKENGDDKVVVWGSGSPVRDFIYVDDVAESFVLALDRHHEELPINVSSGVGVTIKDTVEMIKKVVGFRGELEWDRTKPDGHQVKIFDVTRMKSILHFKPSVDLQEGIEKTYEWFVKNYDKVMP